MNDEYNLLHDNRRLICLQPFDTTQVLFYEMDGISFIDFNLATCDFLKFDQFEIPTKNKGELKKQVIRLSIT